MRSKEIVSLLFIVCVVAAGIWLWTSPSGVKQAPEVTFSYLDGQKVSLQNLRGRPVLVTFWATTCSGCLKEMPHLISLYNELSVQGFEIVGVAMSYDPPNRVLELVTERQVPYPISLDIDGNIAKAFGDVMLTPTSFLITAEGKIIKQKIGEMDTHALREQIISLLPSVNTNTTAFNYPQ